MADNTVLNAGSGGDTIRDFSEAGGTKWPACVVAYATTISPGANVLQAVTASFGLPVAQQGTWTVTANVGTTNGLALDATVSGLVVAQGSATSGEKGILTQGAVTTAAPTYATGQTSPISIDTAGNIRTLATQGGSWTVTANVGTTGGLALDATVSGLVVAQGSTTSGQKGHLAQGAVTTAAPTSTTGPTSPISIDTAGNIRTLATQGGTWTVTANVGTTGGLALDTSVNGLLVNQASATSGQKGPLAQGAVTTSAPSYTTGQTSPVSLDTAGNMRVLASQTGTWNIGTVTAVTAITNALPAGTNLLGQVSACGETSTVYNGTSALTPQFARFSVSASGVNANIVAATASKRVRVLRYRISANGLVNAKWQSSTGNVDISGLHYLTTYASGGGAYCPVGLFQTAAGDALNLNLSAAIAVDGELTYVVV